MRQRIYLVPNGITSKRGLRDNCCSHVDAVIAHDEAES